MVGGLGLSRGTKVAWPGPGLGPLMSRFLADKILILDPGARRLHPPLFKFSTD